MVSLNTTLATSFDAIAADYARFRPDYPAALLDAVEEAAGRPLAGARVVEVGAGTGIASRLLLDRGARLVAVEPGAGMAAELRRTLPTAALLRGDGNALPLAAGTADVVCYAQSFHWTDPARSLPEARRVLRPGGALTLWWNTPDLSHDWVRRQEERLAERCPAYHGVGQPVPAPELLREHGFAPVRRSVRWSRRVRVADHLRRLRTHSFVSVMGVDAEPVLRAEEKELLAVFPDGWVTEPFVVELVVGVAAAD